MAFTSPYPKLGVAQNLGVALLRACKLVPLAFLMVSSEKPPNTYTGPTFHLRPHNGLLAAFLESIPGPRKDTALHTCLQRAYHGKRTQQGRRAARQPPGARKGTAALPNASSVPSAIGGRSAVGGAARHAPQHWHPRARDAVPPP